MLHRTSNAQMQTVAQNTDVYSQNICHFITICHAVIYHIHICRFSLYVRDASFYLKLSHKHTTKIRKKSLKSKMKKMPRIRMNACVQKDALEDLAARNKIRLEHVQTTGKPWHCTA